MQNLITNLSNVINSNFHIIIKSQIIKIKYDENINITLKLRTNKDNIFAFYFLFFNQISDNFTKINDGIIFYEKDNSIAVMLIVFKTVGYETILLSK